jgi:Transposase
VSADPARDDPGQAGEVGLAGAGEHRGALVKLGDHLRCERVTRVVLESTSDYGRPFYYLIEAAGLTVWLVNAAQAKNIPGRPKTDKIDAMGLAKLAERSMVSPSLVLTEPIRRVRDWPGPGSIWSRTAPGSSSGSRNCRGRPDQDLGGAHRRARHAQPGHDRGADRRTAQPEAPAELAQGRARRNQALVFRSFEGRCPVRRS